MEERPLKKKRNARETAELRTATAKFLARYEKRAEKYPFALGLMTASRRARIRHMVETQQKERQEGKMSGITVSLPSVWARGLASRDAQDQLKKLRSHATFTPEDGSNQGVRGSSSKSLIGLCFGCPERRKRANRCGTDAHRLFAQLRQQ